MWSRFSWSRGGAEGSQDTGVSTRVGSEQSGCLRRRAQTFLLLDLVVWAEVLIV